MGRILRAVIGKEACSKAWRARADAAYIVHSEGLRDILPGAEGGARPVGAEVRETLPATLALAG